MDYRRKVDKNADDMQLSSLNVEHTSPQLFGGIFVTDYEHKYYGRNGNLSITFGK